jgi:antitoxin ParD1/3/4
MPTLQITLTPQLEQLIQDKIATGMFCDPSDVVSQALRNLDGTSEEEIIRQRFGPALQEGIEQAKRGEFSEKTLDQMIAEAELEDLAQ